MDDKRREQIGFLREHEFDDYREEYYDSTQEYRRALRIRSIDDNGDSGSYLPPPTEIQRRMLDVQWLKEQGFPEVFIRSVMQYETPELRVVMDCFRKGLTAEQILKIFRPFLILGPGRKTKD
jgi:hypothetical protein